MGILNLLPPQLIDFLTWLVLFLASSVTILILSIAVGRLLGGFVEDIMGWIK